jgi:hypothetical protein
MAGLAPLVQNGRNEAVGADADIRGPDDKVMGFDVSDLGFFVGSDAFVLIMPFGEQEADGSAHQLWQVADDEPGVFAGELDLATEAQIVAHEHTGPGDDAGGEGLVVGVSKSEHPAVVIAGFLGVNFHQAEVAQALMRQRMCLGADAQVGGGQRLLNRADELVMRNRAPTVGVTWCGDSADFVEVHMRGSAMQGEVGAAALDEPGLRFEVGNHDDGFLSGMKRGRTHSVRIRPPVDVGVITV